MSALIVATLLITTPPVDCSLVVNGENIMGGAKLTHKNVTAYAKYREHYTLSFKDTQIQAKLVEPAPLMSVTWQPSERIQATFTCTSKVVKPRKPIRNSPIFVACLSASGEFSIGANTANIKSPSARVLATANGYEMRVQAESDHYGTAIVWSDHNATKGNATVVTLGSEQFSCWRM